MKLAPIVPPNCEDLLPDTDYVMAFADIAIKNPKYARFYAQRKGVIMDNQIYEGQEGLGVDELVFILGFIQPAIAIVPDVRGDVDGTIMRARTYLGALRSKLPYTTELCGVVQGKNAADWEKCFDFLVNQPAIQRIAAPIKPYFGVKRAHVYTTHIADRARRLGKKVHWLGHETFSHHKDDNIYTIDSAEPTNATIWGVDLEAVGDFKVAYPRPPQFMEWGGYEALLRERKDLLWKNIAWMSRMYSDPPATSTASAARVTLPTA